jgi:hypothetical protein
MRSIHFLAALAAMGLITVSTRRAGAASPPTASGTVTTTGTGALNTDRIGLGGLGSGPILPDLRPNFRHRSHWLDQQRYARRRRLRDSMGGFVFII